MAGVLCGPWWLPRAGTFQKTQSRPLPLSFLSLLLMPTDFTSVIHQLHVHSHREFIEEQDEKILSCFSFGDG